MFSLQSKPVLAHTHQGKSGSDQCKAKLNHYLFDKHFCSVDHIYTDVFFYTAHVDKF